MTYLSLIIRIILCTVILLFTGFLQNVSAHQSCQDTQKDEICPAHGVLKDTCSLCNHTMKNDRYKEFLEKQCEHNISVLECNGCRHEIGAVRIDPSIVGEIITIKDARSSNIDITLKATGEVGFNQDRFVIVAPRVSGVVKEVLVGLGDRVEKGQVLALLDSIELGKFKADYMKSKALMEFTEKTYHREMSLYNKNIISEKRLQEAAAAYEQAQIALKSLREKLKLMGQQESDIQDIEEGHVSSLITVTAPFDGTVIKRNASVGGLKDAFTPLFTISDLTHLWVWFDIYEKDITKVRMGSRVAISVASYPGEQFEGLVTYIGATIDERTRTVKVRAEIDNQHGKLKPGMFARILLQVETGGDSPVVPEETVQTDGQRHFIFVPLKEGYFLRRDVTIGTRMNGYVKILNGLHKNDRVVVNGSFLLKSELMKEQFGEGCIH
ncbi:MAG: efflux RND transporter periplasmic adaptor subunit [Candidatus Loosdrechtia sp.]|uniref:efflux RND transporter periplasmic adaptor subunit n=1 Tax=Candidatus Loosdrechtia sp. TaxID=3101272 RepID=UPI003A74B413|nr:MAG: efflux RND transporter periplasmic adaptor subunit [Candidatus Jettenia sp. AMX2]